MRNIVVIGAAGGVGSAVAGLLAARGDQVHGTVLNEAEEAQAREKTPALASVGRVDLGDAEAALAQTRSFIAGIGDVDAVAVCAAISPYGPLETTPLALARKTFEINALSDLAIYQAAVPALRKTKGRLVFVSSMAGRTAMPFIGAYTASKYALEAFADIMRRESTAHGVSVSLVEPGGIKTPMVDEQLATIVGRIASLSDEERRLYGNLYTRFQQLASESHHGGGSSSAEDVARVLLRALDDETPAARYIAGDDAKGLIEMGRTLSDAEFDAFFAQMFAVSEDA